MDELRGPNIQTVLHVKEGIGFGFLRTPFVVSGSLNGYILETDPAVPTHAPIFDAELVWEADKRRFRSLRVQNVPVKVEVYTTATQGRKDKVGYLLLSLLGAQPCPSNKINDIKYSWHRLLGVKTEGKCCHPQLMMSLTVEDRISTPTPRNELRMFHSNEVAYPNNNKNPNDLVTETVLLTMEDYIAESKKTVSSPDLQPRLLCDEGIIQIGDGKHLFLLSFVIGSIEHLDVLLPESLKSKMDTLECCISYSVFTHEVMTDRVPVSAGSSAAFNQRTALRVCGTLRALRWHWQAAGRLVAGLRADTLCLGMYSIDLLKLVPTDNLEEFLSHFCNGDNALKIQERCYILRCEGASDDPRKPYVDVEMSLKYMGIKNDNVQSSLHAARSTAHIPSAKQTDPVPQTQLQYTHTSCTDLNHQEGRAYTNNLASTDRFKNAAGDAIIQTNELTELIKKMYENFTISQEKLLSSTQKPATSDMQIQCESEKRNGEAEVAEKIVNKEKKDVNIYPQVEVTQKIETVHPESSKSDTCILRPDKDAVKKVLSTMEREEIMQKCIEELEDWKEKQQELYKCQLQRKEEYHLELLAAEWGKKRSELEGKLTRGIEQCRTLAADLARATDDFRLRGYRSHDRENKLLEAKKALEAHYTAKYQELREASQKMEDDVNHQLKLKDMRIEELEMKIMQLEKQVDVLKNNLKNSEKEAENKYSGLTKDQTASLIQELRCLEEKLDSAVQSKSFFKEQWGRAVRELHLVKLGSRRQLLTQLKNDRRHLADLGLDTIVDQDEAAMDQSRIDVTKLKDDFYVDILANTPTLNADSIISAPGPEGMHIYGDNKNTSKPLNDKLSELISQRDCLASQPEPDERTLGMLNHEIRSMLLNCGT